jgi:predicted transcriptional regulator
MRVDNLCNRNAIVAEQNTNVLRAAELMREHHVGSLVIIDSSSNGRKPIGIVSDRDIVIEVLAKGISLKETRLKDIMNQDLICVRDTDDTMDVVRIMCMEGIRRVPVIDSAGNLVGILTMDDVFEMLAGELSNLAILICRQQRHEKRLKC